LIPSDHSGILNNFKRVLSAGQRAEERVAKEKRIFSQIRACQVGFGTYFRRPALRPAFQNWRATIGTIGCKLRKKALCEAFLA
ncbi:MAG: hypothetical protein V4733_03170, partial [Verrucomicrobiota bacterium]